MSRRPRPGTLRGLCVSSATRVAALPNVPTATEAGFPDVVSTNWFVLAAPAGLDPAIAARLDTAAQEILAESTVRERLEAASIVALERMTPAEIPAFVAREQAKWAPIVRASGAAIG